jgi:hypothetical protein
MRLFGKKRLTEEGMADALVSKIAKDIYGNWPVIRDNIRESLSHHVDVTALPELSDAHAPPLILATVFVDMRAVKNELSAEQFRRIRQHVFRKFQSLLDENQLAEVFDSFQKGWDAALARNENPVSFGVAPILYDLMDLSMSPVDEGRFSYDPVTLLCLTQCILPSLGFCKFALNEYEITQSKEKFRRT